MKYSYRDIANSFGLWSEYIDPIGLDSRETFDNKSEREKIGIIEECFGKEESE